ncbi:histidine triad nucleotide-binding protein [Deefgea salmonis]|uniref:Histidine triad nucleotide-binding protein n=1 Tax=Deefgea salmonis TaxID=2875502 RepID=A0ABS8BLM9_9NEIS|nr:histidine triad nucleotide-binding protein [Deefgea salmonis]MCB5196522.1 histidine triad nucleotide-binding protein [Deefgea salmonis]
MSDCLFCKIVDKQIPAKIIFEDDDVIAFNDIRPAAPVHFLVIPKRHIDSLLACTEQDQVLLGQLLARVPQIAREQGLQAGFKTAINTGEAGGQEVYHLHLHVLGTPEES